jgi:hypothetical protein
MAKRENRIAPIQHEIRQITNLKTLQPNTTAPEAQRFSDCLIDIAAAALEEVAALESGQPLRLKRIARLMELFDQMVEVARGDTPKEER